MPVHPTCAELHAKTSHTKLCYFLRIIYLQHIIWVIQSRRKM